MSDPITVTHTTSGSVLHVASWRTHEESGESDLHLVGGYYTLHFPASELEFPPTPRPLPTHVGARVEITYADGGRELWLFDGISQWENTNGERSNPERMQNVADVARSWVELVPKTGDGAE
jgi:hypothetical protein